LQNQAYGRWRRAEDRLPAHGRAGIGLASVARQSELAARLVAAGKRFVVEAKADITW